jgi:hypothetical protein
MINRPQGPSSAARTSWSNQGVTAEAVTASESGGAGRSSGDDGSLVDVKRIAVALVEKSVGASRDEAGS